MLSATTTIPSFLVLITTLVCTSSAATAPATRITANRSDLPLLANVSQAHGTATLRGSSSPSSANISLLALPLGLPTPLPYGFSVPGTTTYLRLGFGLPRRAIDPMSLAGLIALLQHLVHEGIVRDGEDAFPGLGAGFGGNQAYGRGLGDGFSFEVWNVRNSGRYFTWGQVGNVVEGLKLFLLEGERCYLTAFNFWDGPGWWRRNPLGHGGIVVERDREEG